MSIQNLLEDLQKAAKLTRDLGDIAGRVQGVQIGLVTNNEDPMKLARVKATVGNQGGKSETDWLMRAIFMPLASLPVPSVGDTILIGYQDGDPHKGFYLGILQNLLNPSASPDSMVIRVGQGILTIGPAGFTYKIGGSTLEVNSEFIRQTVEDPRFFPALKTICTQNASAIAWDGVYAFTINGQSVTRGGSQSSTDPDPWKNPVPIFVPPVLPPSPQIH